MAKNFSSQREHGARTAARRTAHVGAIQENRPPLHENEPTSARWVPSSLGSSFLNNEGFLYCARLLGLPKQTRRFTQLLRGGRNTFIIGHAICDTSLDFEKVLSDDGEEPRVMRLSLCITTRNSQVTRTFARMACDTGNDWAAHRGRRSPTIIRPQLNRHGRRHEAHHRHYDIRTGRPRPHG